MTPEEREVKRKQKLEDERLARQVAKKLSGWREVCKYPASSGGEHTIETDGHGNYKCTCQAFRIRKINPCRHIAVVQQYRGKPPWLR